MPWSRGWVILDVGGELCSLHVFRDDKPQLQQHSLCKSPHELERCGQPTAQAFYGCNPKHCKGHFPRENQGNRTGPGIRRCSHWESFSNYLKVQNRFARDTPLLVHVAVKPPVLLFQFATSFYTDNSSCV